MHGIYRHSNNCTCSILFFGHCTQRMHLHPGIIPLAARSRLAAGAADAKIRLWRIKHRRVQTAAVGLCRGVYVFVGRVLLRIMFRRVQTAAVGLCRGVMYSLAGWSRFYGMLFPADYVPACADSHGGAKKAAIPAATHCPV